MTTHVFADTFVYTATYITDKMLRSVQYIVRESGLNPAKFADDWECVERGIRSWLKSRNLERVVLEVFDPSSDRLVGRWDFDIVYGYGLDGDGEMWVDTDAIRYAIRKAGVWPSECQYRIVAVTSAGRPDVLGWSRTSLRSTEGLSRHSIGTTIGAVGAGAGTAYWRRD